MDARICISTGCNSDPILRNQEDHKSHKSHSRLCINHQDLLSFLNENLLRVELKQQLRVYDRAFTLLNDLRNFRQVVQSRLDSMEEDLENLLPDFVNYFIPIYNLENLNIKSSQDIARIRDLVSLDGSQLKLQHEVAFDISASYDQSIRSIKKSSWDIQCTLTKLIKNQFQMISVLQKKDQIRVQKTITKFEVNKEPSFERILGDLGSDYPPNQTSQLKRQKRNQGPQQIIPIDDDDINNNNNPTGIHLNKPMLPRRILDSSSSSVGEENFQSQKSQNQNRVIGSQESSYEEVENSKSEQRQFQMNNRSISLASDRGSRQMKSEQFSTRFGIDQFICQEDSFTSVSGLQLSVEQQVNSKDNSSSSSFTDQNQIRVQEYQDEIPMIVQNLLHGKPLQTKVQYSDQERCKIAKQSLDGNDKGYICYQYKISQSLLHQYQKMYLAIQENQNNNDSCKQAAPKKIVMEKPQIKQFEEEVRPKRIQLNSNRLIYQNEINLISGSDEEPSKYDNKKKISPEPPLPPPLNPPQKRVILGLNDLMNLID